MSSVQITPPRPFSSSGILLSDTKDMYPVKINDHLWVLGNDYFHHYLIMGEESSALVEMGISATAGIVLALSSFGVEPDYLDRYSPPQRPHYRSWLSEKFISLCKPWLQELALNPFSVIRKASQSLIAEDKHMLKALTARGLCPQASPVKNAPSLAGCMLFKMKKRLILGI